MPAVPRPPFDPELADFLTAALEVFPGLQEPLLPEQIPAQRAASAPTPVDQVLAGRAVELTDHVVPGYEGGEIVISVVRPTDPAARTDRDAPAPAVYSIHGGGMVTGSRLGGLAELADWAERYGAVCATVDYRLAPEHPDPVPVEDCYAGLVWFAAQAAGLGFDPDRLMVSGGSAGGGLAAGTTLLARDRQGPAVAAQLLVCPMLDDRDATVSTLQFDGVGVWDRVSNRTGWGALLGHRYGTDDVSPYAAPIRATDLSGLPPTFVDVGSAEVFRDEAVAYASAIWAAGGDCELHVWPGGYHAFDALVPDAAVSRAARAVREAWVARHLTA
ncbi:alpha/beta hydrolase [Antribacter gilvus]|uniref:alpha/beta hydrolase n=1 Tax=Antribacter gilvus TaxID=2304675 RepID=UPI000F7B3273|nr:alpha/beta hydrolase [Antribacter gilvus]